MKLSKIALMMAALTASSAAWSHGYIEVPESRAYKCKLGSNTDCGRAQWEPQSVEQVSGFPGGATPRDGQLASGGVGGFEPLDRQGVNVWALNTMKPDRRRSPGTTPPSTKPITGVITSPNKTGT